MEEVVVVDDRVVFRFNPGTRTPGPFEVAFSYREAGTGTERTWQGRQVALNTRLSFRSSGALWGVATLRLDDALAFSGRLTFADVPF